LDFRSRRNTGSTMASDRCHPEMIEAAPQGERRVTYKALNSETVAAARDAADAAGLTTEDWLTRAILENAHVANVPGAEPTTVAPAPPTEPTPSRSTFAEVTPTASAEPRTPDARMEAMARHLRRAKAAADQSGMSVSEWLTQAIMESARAQHAHPHAANDRRESAQAAPGAPGMTVPGHTSDASMDPLQERLARIVTARRHESARNFRQTEQPMLLATRPQAKEGQRRFWPNLDQPHSGRPAFSWFWTAVLVILIAIAGLVWSLPYLPEPVSPGSANVAPPLNSVAEDRQSTPPGADQPKTTKAADTAKPKPVSKVALAAVARDAMPKPVAENVAWYKRAAEAGNHYAQFELAKLYIRGESVKRDPSEAARLLAIAARDGDLADAQYALGVMYERGIGVKKSLVEATLLYQRAADQGYVLALTQVGIAHLEGRGVKKDYAKARTYLERAAESGEMNAQYALGQMHEKGLGFKKDRVRALKWFILAAQRGHKLAAERLENISYKTSDEERERANELAREHNQRFKVSPN
jgi:TPR repeat protein